MRIEAVARELTVSDEALSVGLADGRTIAVPLIWFPRLAYGTPAECANWRFIGGGVGIHWPDLDEDISVVSLLGGRRSGEGRASLRRWIERRGRGTRQHNGERAAFKGCFAARPVQG
jgi:hypothetical protein